MLVCNYIMKLNCFCIFTYKLILKLDVVFSEIFIQNQGGQRLFLKRVH